MENIIRLTQKELYNKLLNIYKKEKIYYHKDKYILVKGKAPIMLVAHLDTVHKEKVKIICKSDNGEIWMSPQGIGGDDRCGVYALNKIYSQVNIKPWLLFTCDEEIGGIGANQFCKDHKANKLPKELNNLKAIIEIDRKGRNDAVFYDCDNPEFESYINTKGFKTAHGSFSDISYIAPALGIAAVNLSSGYYNAHTLNEYINTKDLNNTINKTIEIVKESIDSTFPQYEYKESNMFDWYDYGYLGLPDIPQEIEDEYYELLDLYSEDELEELRFKFGDTSIAELYISEFGKKRYQELKEYSFVSYPTNNIKE